jgi:hypothetical protein
VNAHPSPTPPGPPPTYIWTWVDSHGYTITEPKKPPAYVSNAVAYMTVAEHNRIIASIRSAAASMLKGRGSKTKGTR